MKNEAWSGARAFQEEGYFLDVAPAFGSEWPGRINFLRNGFPMLDQVKFHSYLTRLTPYLELRNSCLFRIPFSVNFIL
jgi:hypothetical protein